MQVAGIALQAVQPFRLDFTTWVLRRRAKNSTDIWDGQTYRRVLTVKQPVLVEARQNSAGLTIDLKSSLRLSEPEQTKLKDLVTKMLGLNIGLGPFYELVTNEPALNLLAEQFKGVKPTRYPTLFEALVNAIACQQVSLDAGISLLNRLTQTFGARFKDSTSEFYAFPNPEELLGDSEESLQQLGFSRQKSRAIWNLAYGLANSDIDLDQLESASNVDAIAYLQSIRGIGRWSAEYVLLRGLGRLDVFPGDDIGGQNNIQLLLNLQDRPDYTELGRIAAKWHPFAGLIYFHLLLNKLHKKELV